MSEKDMIINPEWITNQRVTERPEIHQAREHIGAGNLLVKMEMVKELHCKGLSIKAIGRILHLSEEVMEQSLEIAEAAGVESKS